MYLLGPALGPGQATRREGEGNTKLSLFLPERRLVENIEDEKKRQGQVLSRTIAIDARTFA
jgi:hypothetical protein